MKLPNKEALTNKITVIAKPQLKQSAVAFFNATGLNMSYVINRLIITEVPRLQEYIRQEVGDKDPSSAFLTPEIRDRITLACKEGTKTGDGKRSRAATLDIKISDYAVELLNLVTNGVVGHNSSEIQSNIPRSALFNLWLFYLTYIPERFWRESDGYAKAYKQAASVLFDNDELHLRALARDPLKLIHETIDRAAEDIDLPDEPSARFQLYDYSQELTSAVIQKRNNRQACGVHANHHFLTQEQKAIEAENAKTHVSCMTTFVAAWRVPNTDENRQWWSELTSEFELATNPEQTND